MQKYSPPSNNERMYRSATTQMDLCQLVCVTSEWRYNDYINSVTFLKFVFQINSCNVKLDSNCICNWTSSQHYSNGRVTLTFDLWTPKNYTLVPFPKYYHWSKFEVPRCYGSKVRVDRTKVGRNKNKKNNNQHENNTSPTEWEDVTNIQTSIQTNKQKGVKTVTSDLRWRRLITTSLLQQLIWK